MITNAGNTTRNEDCLSDAGVGAKWFLAFGVAYGKP
jgi:hypothetical protein